MAQQITIKSTFKSIDGYHIAVSNEQEIGRIVGGVGGKLRITNRIYNVSFNSGTTYTFQKLSQFTFDSISYNVFEGSSQLGVIKRKTVKGSYEVNLYEVEMQDSQPLTIDEGWVISGTTKYTSFEGHEIVIAKGRTGLFDWKVTCSEEIPEFDIALILFMKAMCGLMIQ